MSDLPVGSIRLDGGTQMRVCLVEEAVDAYAENMERGDEFPPVTVFHDGNSHWLADGFHRVAARSRLAAKHIGTASHAMWSCVDADIQAGTRLDAIRHAIAANRTNGLRRTNADKQIAVRAALTHPDLKDKSDRAIAEAAGVSSFMVNAARQVIGNITSRESTHRAVNTETDKRMRTGMDGKQYPVRQKPAPIESPKRSPGGERETARVETSDHRASATPKQRHVCPTCNGEGFIE
jgi:hypothetical protein